MRAWIAGILICALLPLGAASAATKLMPAEIQSTFFTGEAFTAATPGGVKFKMTFTADGKAKPGDVIQYRDAMVRKGGGIAIYPHHTAIVAEVKSKAPFQLRCWRSVRKLAGRRDGEKMRSIHAGTRPPKNDINARLSRCGRPEVKIISAPA